MVFPSFKDAVLERFLRYVRVDTQSSEESTTSPTTQKQFDLAYMLEDDMKKMGLSDVRVDSHCYVWGTLPSNIPQNHPAFGKVPSIGLSAHLDTVPGPSGANVNPRIITHYDGGPIALGNSGEVITASNSRPLKEFVGHTLVVTDGTTLLGADDKLGIAEILAAVDYLKNHPEIIHGQIRLCFSPDEEVGYGMDYFNYREAQMEVAYTLDGEDLGILNNETFSADGAKVRIKGIETHPKDGKGKMVNALRVASAFIASLPYSMAPETTENKEPFIHPGSISGDVAEAKISLILRDFRDEGLVEQKTILERVAKDCLLKFPGSSIEVEVYPQYRNMRPILEKNPHVLNCLWNGCLKAGVTPRWQAVRGGTDGSKLSQKGVPTPNIFIGAYNSHSVKEFASMDDADMATKTIIYTLLEWVNSVQ